jgi:hypothetical protein
MKNIYSKLQVNNRAEAISRAQVLDLIPWRFTLKICVGSCRIRVIGKEKQQAYVVRWKQTVAQRDRLARGTTIV